MKRILTLLLITGLAIGSFDSNPRTINVILMKTADYSMTATDYFVGANTASNDIVFTLPAISSIQGDIITQYDIGHFAGSYNVQVECDGTDEFVYGNTYFNLGTEPFRISLAIYPDGVGKWGLVDDLTIRAEAHRDASWSSFNFSSMTIIPWDAEPANTQDELLVYTSGSSARYTVKTPGTYEIAYVIDIDSTGGSTWNATSQVYKNGVALENTQARTGNYGNEDQSMCMPAVYVELDTDDYLDLRIDQNSLTGNLVHSMFMIELTL